VAHVTATFRFKGSSIVATVPTGATTGPIRVITPGGSATSPTFIVFPRPAIDGFTPTTGPSSVTTPAARQRAQPARQPLERCRHRSMALHKKGRLRRPSVPRENISARKCHGVVESLLVELSVGELSLELGALLELEESLAREESLELDEELELDGDELGDGEDV
jgi:hypothetical protein